MTRRDEVEEDDISRRFILPFTETSKWRARLTLQEVDAEKKVKKKLKSSQEVWIFPSGCSISRRVAGPLALAATGASLGPPPLKVEAVPAALVGNSIHA